MLARIKNEPALVSGAVQAVLALLIAFGLDLSPVQTAAILAVTAALLALLVRSKVTPTGDSPGEDGAIVVSPLITALIVIALVLLILALIGVRIDVLVH